jgi:hypothetical protein
MKDFVQLTVCAVQYRESLTGRTLLLSMQCFCSASCTGLYNRNINVILPAVGQGDHPQ